MVRAHATEVQGCFDRALMEHGDLHGRLTVRASVDPNGHVLGVTPTAVMQGGGRLQACVVEAFETLDLSAAERGRERNGQLLLLVRVKTALLCWARERLRSLCRATASNQGDLCDHDDQMASVRELSSLRHCSARRPRQPVRRQTPLGSARRPAAPAPASAPTVDAAPAPRCRRPRPGRPTSRRPKTDSPPEMKFGRSRGAAPSDAQRRRRREARRRSRRALHTGPRTMEEVAGASIQELTFRSVRWRYSLNFFGDVSMSGGKPAEGEHVFGFGLGGQDMLIRGELSENIVATTEMAFEAGEDGGIGIDIERFNVRWQIIALLRRGRAHAHRLRLLEQRLSPRSMVAADDRAPALGRVRGRRRHPARALGRRRRGLRASRRLTRR